MAEERVVVESHLGVECVQAPVGRDDQRIDLDQHRLLGHKGRVELGQERGDPGHEVEGNPGGEGQPAAVKSLEADQRVHVEGGQRLRLLRGHALDVDAAPGREHDQRRFGAAVEDDGGVVLVGDLHRLSHPDLVDGEPADVHAEDRGRVLTGLLLVTGELDPARLAPAARQHLRLDHARIAELAGRRDRLGDGGHRASGLKRDPVAGEQLLALVLEEIHRPAADSS